MYYYYSYKSCHNVISTIPLFPGAFIQIGGQFLFDGKSSPGRVSTGNSRCKIKTFGGSNLLYKYFDDKNNSLNDVYVIGDL